MEPEKKSNGAFIGSVIIIVILIVGGIYIWQSKVKNALELKKIESETLTPADTQELNDLEQYLNATDTTIEIETESVN